MITDLIAAGLRSIYRGCIIYMPVTNWGIYVALIIIERAPLIDQSPLLINRRLNKNLFQSPSFN
jgi:hypothetical protein